MRARTHTCTPSADDSPSAPPTKPRNSGPHSLTESDLSGGGDWRRLDQRAHMVWKLRERGTRMGSREKGNKRHPNPKDWSSFFSPGFVWLPNDELCLLPDLGVEHSRQLPALCSNPSSHPVLSDPASPHLTLSKEDER